MKSKHVLWAILVVVLLFVAGYSGYPLLLRYIVRNQVKVRLGPASRVDLAGARVEDGKVVLRQLGINRPGLQLNISRMSVSLDPWKYLFGRKVLDEVVVDSATVHLTPLALMHRGPRKRQAVTHGKDHLRIPIFNHLLFKDVSMDVIMAGSTIGSMNGDLGVNIRSGHETGRSYEVRGRMQIHNGQTVHHGVLSGVYSSFDRADLVLKLDSPVRIPFRHGMATFKSVRLHNQQFSLPSCGFRMPGVSVAVDGLSVRFAHAFATVSHGLFRLLDQVKADHVVLKFKLRPPAPRGTANAAPATENLHQFASRLLHTLNGLVSRVGNAQRRVLGHHVPAVDVLDLAVWQNNTPLFDNARMVFKTTSARGWSLSVKGTHSSLLVRTARDAQNTWLDTDIDWHSKGCAILKPFIPQYVTLPKPCGTDLHITDFRQSSTKGWSMNLQFSTGPVTVAHPVLCEEPVTFDSLAFSGHVAYKNGQHTLTIRDGHLVMNGMDSNFSVEIALGLNPFIHASVSIPKQKAMDLLRALPAPMSDRIADMRFAGTFAFKGDVRLDLGDLSKSMLSLHPDCSNLKLVSVPKAMDIATLSGDFIQTIQTDDGQEIQRTIGPDSPDWVPLDAVPPYFIDCLLASEDVTFFQHHGFSVTAIRDALITDLTQHKVVRGASTITQQLAKNLFLSKSRSMARKLQEAVLTWYLESTLTKQRILELYLNIIEWGPYIYGLKQAALHYFGKDVPDLDLAESAFLVAIIPNPVQWHKECLALKRVPKVVKSKMIHILKILATRKTIDQDVVKEAMQEPVDFNMEAMRTPVKPGQPASTYPHRQK